MRCWPLAGQLPPAGFLVVSASAAPWLHSPAAVLLERREDLWEQIDALGGLLAARKFEAVTLPGGHFFQHGIDDLIPVVPGLLQNVT